MKRQRRPRDFSVHPSDPCPTVVQCEWGLDELAEKYVTQQRARMMSARAKAEGQGSGDQAAAPTRHADDDDQSPQRQKPGV